MSHLKHSPKAHSQKKNLENMKSLPEPPSENNEEEATYSTLTETQIYIALVETDNIKSTSNQGENDALNEPHAAPHQNKQEIHETTVITNGNKSIWQRIIKQMNWSNIIFTWVLVAVIAAACAYIAWEVSRSQSYYLF